MSLSHIDDISGPPIVGKFYMVPAILMERFNGQGELWWPITGPMHTDADHFNFPWPHYHVDARFLTTRHVRGSAYDMGSRFTQCPYEAHLAAPVHAKYAQTNRNPPFPEPPKPELRRMRCARTGTGYPYGTSDAVQGLRKDHAGDTARRNAEGHLICPHRGARLDQLVPDAEGVITCPLHGLRFNADTGKCIP